MKHKHEHVNHIHAISGCTTTTTEQRITTTTTTTATTLHHIGRRGMDDDHVCVGDFDELEIDTMEGSETRTNYCTTSGGCYSRGWSIGM
jgi:hypothetical protein